MLKNKGMKTRMDEAEAIHYLDLYFSDAANEEFAYTEEFAEAVGIAKEALEKQIIEHRGERSCENCKNRCSSICHKCLWKVRRK